MPSTWRTVRVFISSTFRDMHAERDHLIRFVFPALRERLLPYGIHLVDIDLRWGVTREQAENDRVLELCLQQIDECRPFFIGILGERYGWVPTRYPVEDLKRYGWIQARTGRSLTELEILHGVLNNPDMRGRAFFYLRDPKALAGVPEELKREVYVEQDPGLTAALAALKTRIRKSGYPVMDRYRAQWDANLYDRERRAQGRLTDLDAFGRRVLEQLWEGIKAQYLLPDTPPAETHADPLAEERNYHDLFMESRLRVYIGRETIQDQLFEYLNGQDTKPLLVTGPSGSGKSAVLARLVQSITQLPAQSKIKNLKCKMVLVSHFVGASPSSTNIRHTVRRFCQELQAAFRIDGEIPEEYPKLVSTFCEMLGKVPAESTVVFVMDRRPEVGLRSTR